MFRIILYLLLIISPFFFTGVINKIKAVWAGRKGSPLLQNYYDFFKLIKKGEVISKTTTFIFIIAPSINAAAVLISLLIIPLPYMGAIISFPGDFVLFAYILGFAKFMTVLAALDTGSSFEGMGAGREVTFSSIVEPAFFIIIGSLALITNELSFQSIFNIINGAAGYTILIKILFVVSLFIMLVTEGSRIPVDDPNTHLELTMIHEVMILDYSGPDLAFMLYSSALKMLVISMLVANLLIPSSFSLPAVLILFLVIILLVFMAIGLVESLIARSRISHIPQFIFIMTALSLTVFAVIVFFIFGGI